MNRKIRDLNHNIMNILDLLTEQERKVVNEKHYLKGLTIFNEGEKCDELFIVLKGVIEVASYSEIGNEIIFNIIHKSEMFGNNLLFSSSPYFKGDVIVKENAVIGAIKKKDLIPLLMNNESFLMEYLRYGSDFSKNLNDKIKILSFMTAEERLMYLLDTNNNIVEYKSITELSKRLFLTREATSRLVTKLVNQNKIIRKGNKLILQ